MSVRHFLTLLDFSPAELEALIARAIEMKRAPRGTQSCANRVMGMIFAKSSTRTRVSFEVGMAQLGGHSLFLSPRDTQLGRREPIDDTARVHPSMVSIVSILTFGPDSLHRITTSSEAQWFERHPDGNNPAE